MAALVVLLRIRILLHPPVPAHIHRCSPCQLLTPRGSGPRSEWDHQCLSPTRPRLNRHAGRQDRGPKTHRTLEAVIDLVSPNILELPVQLGRVGRRDHGPKAHRTPEAMTVLVPNVAEVLVQLG